MARGINKAILVGHLGHDPSTKYMPSGDAVCNFNMATTEAWNDKATGDRVEKTEWHRIVLFKRLAEIAAEYLHKGSQVYIEGRIQTRKWQDKQGNDRYTTEIVANDLQMLGGVSITHTSGDEVPTPAAGGAPSNSQQQLPVDDDFDDDIPF